MTPLRLGRLITAHHHCMTSCKAGSANLQLFQVEDEVNYDRRSAGQSVLVSGSHLDFFLSDIPGRLMWSALSDNRTGL
jgi:hypothetical protein